MTSPQPEAHRTSRRRSLLLIVKIVVSIALVVVLVRTAGVGDLRHTLASTDPGWLVAGLVLGAAAAALQANQWRGLLDAVGVRRSFWRVLRLDTAARLFDAALPTNIGGDVVRTGLAARGRAELAPAALAVALRRVVSIPGLLVLTTVGMVGSWQLSYAGRARTIGAAVLLAGLVLMIIAAGVLLLGRTRLPRLPRPVDKLVLVLAQARAGSTGRSRPFLRAALRGLLFWMAVVLSQACYIRAVGLSVPPGYAILVVTAVNALSMLPISLGGYGLREGAFGALLGIGGLGTTAQGAAVGICLSAQTLLFGLIGALVYLGLRRVTADVPAVGPLVEVTS